jgi:exopolysaccharide biosynthesis polyprenyl glycosylphosphotransferase
MKTFINSFINEKKKLLLIGDILLVFIAFFLAVSLKVAVSEDFSFKLIMAKVDWMVILWMLLYPIIFYIFELYNQDIFKKNTKLILYISSAVLIATGIIALFSYLFIPHIIIGRTILFLHSVITIPLIFFWRKIFERVFLKEHAKQDKILVIGNSPIVNDIESIIQKGNDIIPNSLTVIREYSENPGTVYINGSTSSKSILELITDRKISTVVVADNIKDFPLLKKQLLDLKFRGITIYDAPYFYEALTGKVPIAYIKDSWFLFRNQGEKFNSLTYRKIKKVCDALLALSGIILSLPLMLLCAVAIKLSSKSPVFFKQERLGQNEKPFTLLKFRTMIDNAEKDTGPKWADKNDSRITKLGKFLRTSHFDELPQLFNVLKGEISFVGPRPIRKYFEDENAKSIPFYNLRHIVRPGITGWAQVQYFDPRAETGPLERLEYDLYYIQNQSIFFDLFIILKTVQTILFRKGQ